jgi:opacity protein-like surface antigen
MKYRLLAKTLSAAVLLSTASTLAGSPVLGLEEPAIEPPVQQSDWYASAFGGTSGLNDVSTISRTVIPGGRPGSPPTIFTRPTTVFFDRGYTYGATFGKHIFQNFRLEGELSYAKYDANNMEDGTRASGPAVGDLTAIYLFANIWYDIPVKGKISPYVGGGIGAAQVDTDVYFGGALSGYQNSDTSFAYQLGLGFTYPIGRKLNLDVGSRYKAVPKLDFNDRVNANVSYLDGELSSSNLQIGLLYDF